MATPILLLNCGSSSVKYQVIDADDEAVLATGLVQKIGLDEGTVDHTVGDRTEHLDHEQAGPVRAVHALEMQRGGPVGAGRRRRREQQRLRAQWLG